MIFLCWSDSPTERFPKLLLSIAMKLANILPSVFVDFNLVDNRFNEFYGQAEALSEIIGEDATQDFSNFIMHSDLYSEELDDKVFQWLYNDKTYYENELVALYSEKKMTLNQFFDLIDFPEFCIFGGPGGMYPSKADWIAAFVRAGLATEPVLTYLCFMENRTEGFTNTKSSDNYVEDYYIQRGYKKEDNITELIIRGAIQFYFETFGVNNLQFKEHMKIM